MCVEGRNLTWTPMLLFLSSALCSQWEVNYHQQHICAVKDSSVVIPCSFYYPDNQRVQSTAWGHEKYDIFNGPFNFDSKLNETKKRFQYIGDTNHNCSLKINQVEHNDTGKHTFRFTTNDKEGKWTGKDGSTLKVVDLSISVTKPNGNRTIKEGDSVNLTCRNGCDGDNLLSAFTWFKNGEPITEGPTLYLSNMSSTNSGNYTCSLKRHTAASSGVIHIDVEYSPKNTSVSVRPSMEADAGSNITLTCSSRANPPVENYTWVKIDDGDIMDVGKGPVFIPGDGGQYLCSASNKHGSQNSSVVTIKMKQDWTFTKDVLIIAIIAAVSVLLIVTIVFAVRRLNRKRTRAPERSEECEEDIQNSVYANYPVFDNNQSQERIGCEEQTLELIYTTVDFHTERKMEQQVASHNDDEGVVYSTVCRKLLNPTYVETP
ncbi:B-cell receptor CD22 isoform X1 [Etheostoma spectabile]|uniref:B-cell receptor CD22 isoform X1 n=1 Tax=Etheostoma spectabile TaxID=54343 RepID=UPI0013AF76BE|nr:B-cell receptor CD22-like isoform X1 [Etheostoma spectabile]